MDGELIEFGGEDVHVHLLVSAHPKTAISNLVGKLKGKSSYFLRKNYWP
jgi:putative transposase